MVSTGFFVSSGFFATGFFVTAGFLDVGALEGGADYDLTGDFDFCEFEDFLDKVGGLL